MSDRVAKSTLRALLALAVLTGCTTLPVPSVSTLPTPTLAGPTPTLAPTASPVPITSPTASPSPTATPDGPSPYTSISLPADVTQFENANGRYLAAHGPRGIFWTGRQILLRDLSFGTAHSLFKLSIGQTLGAWAIGEKYAVIVEGRYERHPNRVPCETAGTLSWRMWVIDTSFLVPTPKQIHEGVQQRDIGCGAAWPVVAVDGARIAWARESGDPDGTQWRVTVETVDGAVESAYDAGRQVDDLELSASGLAFVQGESDLHGQMSDRSLHVATTGAADLTDLGSGPFTVELAGDRVVWTEQLPGSDCLCPGIIRSASLGDLAPDGVGPTATTQGAISAFGDFVSDVGAAIELRTLSTDAWYLVTPTEGAVNVSIEGGWLTWTEEVGDQSAQFFYGVPIEELPLD